MNDFIKTLPCLAVMALAGCRSPQPVAVLPAQPVERPLYEWNDDGGPGDLKVLINLSAQRAYYSRGGRPIGWSYVATGKEGKNTPAGTYKITEKIVDKHSNLYGWIENEWGETIDHDASPGDPVPPGARYVAAPMPYWMRLTSYGIGMHAGHIPQPGAPASHGCIRLPKPFAPVLFDAVGVGTAVTIEYGPPPPTGELHPTPRRYSRPPAPAPANRAAPRRASAPVAPSRATLPPFRTNIPYPDPLKPVPRTRDGLRIVSPDDPSILWPEGHPRARTIPPLP